MAGTLLVYLICLFLSFSTMAKLDRLTTHEYLGEKRLDSYFGRYQPLIFQDIYRGKLHFQDDIFHDNYFSRFIFSQEMDYGLFLKSELNGGMICPNELLSKHFDQIRYAYRLITLSYLLEGQWHLNEVSNHFAMKKGCQFDMSKWLQSCRPKTSEMKKFVDRLITYRPAYFGPLPKGYSASDWEKEYRQQKRTLYSHYRLAQSCKDGCVKETIETHLHKSCQEDEKLMSLICSEEDELYGLSSYRDAYALLGQSNIINTFNSNGEAQGCLRRFSEVMSHKEAKYSVLKNLFPLLQSDLKKKYQERFIQGRVFFYGSSKEFEDKGLKEIFVRPEPLKEPLPPVEVAKVEVKKKEVPEVKVVKKEKKRLPKEDVKLEIKNPVKSAFLLAAEVRRGQDLKRVDVDMLKLKYDYVFTLSMIHNLSEKLKSFMSREALKEMILYDKLGTKEGPVPLLFLKYMIDMEEHQGLFNLISMLGERFYVSNEIDASYTPAPELIYLSNQDLGAKSWSISIIKP